MISIGNIPSSGGAYYTSEQNYYAKGSGLSLWHGGAKQALGLNDGTITAKHLDSIISGRRPDGQPIPGVNLNRIRKTGIDITFSAPKSVSLLAMTDQAPKIYDVQTKAVKRALDFAEKHLATTRIKNPETGKQDHVLGQKMISGLFLHDLSRNNDPQIHTHCVVANLMMDNDGRFRAHHNKPFFDHQMVLSAVYRAELARGLQREGYALRRSGRNGLFEIKDISPKTLERFSTRSKEIQQSLKENDTSSEARSRAALTTRKSKASINRPELVKRWNATLAKDGLYLKTLPESIKSRELSLSQNSEKILEAAILDASERNSQFTYLDIMKTAMTDGIGHTTLDEADQHFTKLQNTGRLIPLHGISTFTTPEILADEKAILREHDKGHLKGKPIGKPVSIQDAIGETGLSQGQQDAAALILSSRSRYVGIQGTAGTGKTTMLRAALPIATQQGHRIIGIAPSGAATQELEETGCFDKTITTAQFLLTPHANKKTIIVLDEASMVGNKDMLSLLKIANKNKVPKFVMMGDVKQLDAVNAGTPFSDLQDHGLRTAKLTEIKRQKSSRHRSAIKALSENDIRKGLAKLKPDIYEAAPESLHRDAVDMWLALKNPKAGIIVQTNRQKAELNHLIKSSLRHQALERGKSAHFRVWRPLSLSNARKALTQSYEGATHIRFNRDVKKIGVKRGDILSIKNIDHEKGLIGLRSKHKEVTFKPSIHARGKGASEVYRQSEIELHKGDRVRFTRGGRGRPINNNDMGEITKIDDKNIHLSLDRNKSLTIPRTSPVFNHIDHGWVNTAHAFQGKTVADTIVIMPSRQSPLTTLKSLYSAISRHRNRVTLVTDNADRLTRNLVEDLNTNPSKASFHSIESATNNITVDNAHNTKSPAHETHQQQQAESSESNQKESVNSDDFTMDR